MNCEVEKWIMLINVILMLICWEYSWKIVNEFGYMRYIGIDVVNKEKK